MGPTKSVPLGIAAILGVFSGCIGSGGSSEIVPPDLGDAGGGAVAGVVTDASLAPLPGAVAALDGNERAATTGDDGRFRIVGVPPGKHTLFVQALGYESAATSVEVAEGQTTEVSVVLEVLPVIEPYHETTLFDGYMACAVGFPRPAGTGPSNYDCKDVAGNRIIHRVDVTPDLASDLTELVWSRNALTAPRELKLERHTFVDCNNQCTGSNMDPFYQSQGRSPHVVHTFTPYDKITDAAPDGAYTVLYRVEATPWNLTVSAENIPFVVFTLEHRFDLYATMFYHEPGAPDFQARPDA